MSEIEWGRPVKRDVISLEAMRKRDLLNDPISGVRVELPRGGIVTVLDGTCQGDGEACYLLEIERGEEVGGVALLKEDLERVIVSVHMPWAHASVKNSRVDLPLGAMVGVRMIEPGVVGFSVACGGGDRGIEVELEKGDARRVVGALFSFKAYMAAREKKRDGK